MVKIIVILRSVTHRMLFKNAISVDVRIEVAAVRAISHCRQVVTDLLAS